MQWHMMLAVWLTVLAAPVAAQSSPVIVAARGAGQIGERYDGYLGYAVPPEPRLRAQVEAVNIRRRTFYSDLAAKRGASRVEVGITAGCELLASVAVGEAYLLGDNVWRRRSPGEALPSPNYCRR
ncbi:MAG: YdbL family protein [Sphingomonas bacterium]|nr:YdbL family protein [Sphingomonas bacterium]